MYPTSINGNQGAKKMWEKDYDGCGAPGSDVPEEYYRRENAMHLLSECRGWFPACSLGANNPELDNDPQFVGILENLEAINVSRESRYAEWREMDDAIRLAAWRKECPASADAEEIGIQISTLDDDEETIMVAYMIPGSMRVLTARVPITATLADMQAALMPR